VDTDLQLDRQALALFRSLLDLHTHDRAGFDAELSSLAPALASRVRRLLDRHHREAGQAEQCWQQALWPGLPAQLGAFTLLREIGRGGMGIVAEAKREAEGFTQRVAIKWIPAWQVDATRRQRFLFERDVVTRLRHPHIAQLVDGGDGEHGELWYAMELVEGKDLLSHCRERRLGLSQRVQLLLDLCDAVAHAHRTLILHRDIKPSNVLVNDEGQLKLIDFGIAKGLDSESDDLTLDAAPMTPRYASPEQLRGERPTTLSDLWQVAALAYELLSGQPARKEGALRKASEAALESEAEHAKGCGLDQARLARTLNGDLDAILEKALRIEPDQRYPSVEALGADLRAWMLCQPVAARRHERWYALGRFVSVHKWAVGFAVLAVIALVIGGSVAIVQSAVARRQTQTAEHVSDLLIRAMLSKSETNLRTTTLPAYFDHVIETIVVDTTLPPERRYALLLGIVVRAQDLGPSAARERGARELTKLASQIFGEESLEHAHALDQLASIELELHPESEAQIRARIDASSAIYRRLHAENTVQFLEHLMTRGIMANLSGDWSQLLKIAERADQLARTLPDLPAEVRISYRMALATAHMNLGQPKQASEAADALLAFALESADESPGAANTIDILRAEACQMRAYSDHASATELCESMVHEFERSGSLTSMSGATVLRSLGIALGRGGDHAAAVDALSRTDRVLAELHGESEMTHLRSQTLRSLGFYAALLGRHTEALAARERVHAWYLTHRKANTFHALDVRMDLADSLLANERLQEARTLLDPDLDLSALGEEQRERWDSLVMRTSDWERPQAIR
jgi:tetratricopeptide (TPR) repeat protein